MDLTSLTRPRRIITTLVLFLLLVGGGTAVAGAGGADGQAASEPMHVPTVGPGLQATYLVDQVRLDRPGQPVQEARPAGQLNATMAIHWTGNRTIVDAAGLVRDVAVIGYEDTREGSITQRANEQWPTDYSLLIDELGLTVARLQEWTEQEVEERPEGRVVRHSDSWSLSFGAHPHLPCGILGPLQGAAWAPGAVVPVAADCIRPGDNTARIVVKEVLVGKDARYLRVDVLADIEGFTRDGQRYEAPVMRLWYQEDISVPVRIEQATWNFAGTQEQAQVYRLAAYNGGPGTISVSSSIMPIGASSSQPSRDIEPVVSRLSPPTPWMFDETGIDHPFPVSEAYEVALNDPTTGLATFLVENPTAYITDASYWEYRREVERAPDTFDREWRLVWRDADSIHYVDIGKRDPVEDAFGLGLNVSQYYYFEPNHRSLAEYGQAVVLPSFLPTVATMWDYYHALASDEAFELGPNMWEWTILWTDPDREPRFLISAGRFQDTPSITTPGEYARDWAYLEYDAYEELLPFRYNERFRTDTVENDPRPVMQASGGTYAVKAFRADEGFWSIPEGRTVVAVGAGAGFLALLYYLWPLLKGLGGIAMFSRVHRDQALDHPLRRELFAHIEANPGAHYQQLIRTTGKGRGTVDHHLQKLQDVGLIAVRRNQGYTCYYAKGAMDARLMDAKAAIKSPVAAGILEAIQRQPGIRTGDLAGQLGVAAPTISYHLKRMREAGLVDAFGSGHGPSPLAHRLQDT